MSAYDVARRGAPWVSHASHEGKLAAVDFLWLLNASVQHGRSLAADWKAAVFLMIQAKLQVLLLALHAGTLELFGDRSLVPFNINGHFSTTLQCWQLSVFALSY